MLPAARRLIDSASFRDVVRRGRRGSSATVVVQALAHDDAPRDARVGFVVSKAVGNAVVRNRVRRRLRHVVLQHLPSAAGFDVVVRALPRSADAEFAELAADLERSWRRAVGATS